MDFNSAWQKALKNTEIIRSRVRALMTTTDTHVPYILLSESSINEGDTVVRKGEVIVQKPAIIVPPNIPHFEGFEFEKEENFNEQFFINFLLVRGVSVPSFHYDNKTSSLEIFEGKLSVAIKKFQDQLQESEDVHTGLIVGAEDCWQFSLLIFICTQVARNADHDIRNLLDEFKKKNRFEWKKTLFLL